MSIQPPIFGWKTSRNTTLRGRFCLPRTCEVFHEFVKRGWDIHYRWVCQTSSGEFKEVSELELFFLAEKLSMNQVTWLWLKFRVITIHDPQKWSCLVGKPSIRGLIILNQVIWWDSAPKMGIDKANWQSKLADMRSWWWGFDLYEVDIQLRHNQIKWWHMLI